MKTDSIIIKNAHTNNLKHVDIELPKHRIVGFTKPQIRNFVCCGLMGWDLIRKALTSNPQLRLLRFNGLGFDQISYADGGN